MKKRGTSQIDWIMSLALFLLYVGWFFVFISPQISFNQNEDSLIIVLKDNFEDEFIWQLEKFPLFIESNRSGSLPLVVNYSQNRSDIEFSDGTPFIVWNDKIIFQGNITPNITTYWIVEGGGYNQTYESTGFFVEEDQASMNNLTVRFENSMIDSVIYEALEKISNIIYKFNDAAFFPNSSFTDYGTFAFYKAETAEINNTVIVFSDSTEIHNYIHTADAEYNLHMDMTVDDYQSYYSDNINFGNFTYSDSKERVNYTADRVTLYNGAGSSFTMFFDDNVDFNFTTYNTSLQISLLAPLAQEYKYRFVFHRGGYNNITRNEYTYRFGVREEIEGIYLENITTDYQTFKDKWQFPKDFNIRVYKNSSAYAYLYEPKYEIGTQNANIGNIFAETVDMFSLSSNGTLTPITVNYRIW